MSKDLRIVFFGTPDFAAAGLKKLVENKQNPVAVVTAPDKPQGRGKKMGMSAVKTYALEAGLPVLQPTNLKSPDFLEELKRYRADLQVVVAFRMLPEAVWNMPPLGTFNLHASLLPQYRGAAPINWAIINGEKETGVTTFFLQHEIDTGEIIFQEKEPIFETDTAGSLYQRLMEKGAELVVKTVNAIASGNYPKQPQHAVEDLKMAPKIFKNDCEINWQQPSENIRNFIRGLAPYPGAWTTLHGKVLKVYGVEKAAEGTNKPIGTFYTDGKKYLRVNTKDGTLNLLDIQLEGKKRMKAEEFLRGYSFPDMVV